MHELAATRGANGWLTSHRSGRHPATISLVSLGEHLNPVAIGSHGQSRRAFATVGRFLHNTSTEWVAKSSRPSEHASCCDHPADDWFDGNLLDLLLSGLVPDDERAAICRCLLDEFGSFADVICAPPKRLEEVLAGFEHAVTFLKGLEIVALRLAQRDIRRRPILSDPAALVRYARVVLGRETIRQNRVLFLNDAMELIADERHRHGTVNHAPVYPREVIKKALHHDATGIVLVQNDPSGRCQPSASDRRTTKLLAESLRGIGISLYDHLIVSRYEHTSFREHGLL